MRFLYLAHRIPVPPNKGDKIRALWELKALSRHHEVDLYCFCDDPEDMKHAPQLDEICESTYVEPMSAWGARWQAGVALLQRRPFSVGYFHSEKLQERIEQAHRERPYDAAVVFSSSMAPYAEKLGIPCVVDLVDCDSEKWREYARERRWTSPLWNLEADRLGAYEEHIAQTFSATTLCTAAEAALLRNRCPDGHILELPHPIDLNYWDPTRVYLSDELKRLSPYVVFTGSMDYWPNIDGVVWFADEILPRLQTLVPEMKFMIAGRAPSPEVRALAHRPGVIVTGGVADIRPYILGAFASVCPLRLARGVQNKVLEAVALGMPVIASTSAAEGLASGVREMLSIADDPARFATAVMTVFASPKNRVEKSREAVRKAYGDELEERFLELVCGNPANATQFVPVGPGGQQ